MQNLVMFEVEPQAEYLFLDAAFAVKGGLRTTLEIIHLLTSTRSGTRRRSSASRTSTACSSSTPSATSSSSPTIR